MAEYLARLLVELGVLGALVGFVSNRYQAKLQAAHERELAALRAQIELKAAVGKAQFDAEFAAVATIWEHVHTVRAAFLKTVIRSGRQKGDEPDESPARDEWLLKRVNGLIDARNAFAHAVYRHQPFYPIEIRQAFERLIDNVAVVDRRILNKPWSPAWFDENDRLCDEFIEAIDETEQLIRTRFSSLRLTVDEHRDGVRGGVK